MGLAYTPAMLVDQSLCVGCDACAVVCKEVYNIPEHFYRTRSYRFTTGTYPEVVTVFNKKSCMHCTDAACVIACPSGACSKDNNGLVVLNKQICIGCNYCIVNCPFQIPQHHRETNSVHKCTFCASRVQRGYKPLCAEVCTSRVVKYGSRASMVLAGNNRVQELKKQGFEEANLYGVDFLGGVRVIRVLQYSPEKYGLPVAPRVPTGAYIWKYLTSPIGGIVGIAGIFVLIFNFLHSRKFKKEIKPE